MRLGYLGPEGTFSHEALLAAVGGASRDEAVALGSTHDVVLAVQDGRVDRALAPIENALEGEVTPVVDALAHDAPDVVLTGEQLLPVRLSLLAAAPTPVGALVRVRSHPQPLGQCAGWLREHAPDAELVADASTAEALRLALADDGAAGPVAAIGSPAAAARTGATVLAEGLGDPHNVTRFVWLARRDGAGAGAWPRTEATDDPAGWRTSVLFDGAGDGDPGWLVRCLSEFAFRGVNLTRIASRPSRLRLGHYVFHVDMDGRWVPGDAVSGGVPGAVRALRPLCEQVRVLGTYPAAP